jgi:hypothetical protein
MVLPPSECSGGSTTRRGLAGENRTAKHPVQVTDGAVERVVSPKEIVAVRRSIGDAG